MLVILSWARHLLVYWDSGSMCRTASRTLTEVIITLTLVGIGPALGRLFCDTVLCHPVFLMPEARALMLISRASLRVSLSGSLRRRLRISTCMTLAWSMKGLRIRMRRRRVVLF